DAALRVNGDPPKRDRRDYPLRLARAVGRANAGPEELARVLEPTEYDRLPQIQLEPQNHQREPDRRPGPQSRLLRSLRGVWLGRGCPTAFLLDSSGLDDS